MSAHIGRSLSGAAKRKLKKDKEAAGKRLLSTIPKLSRFGFSSNAPHRDNDDGIELLRDGPTSESDETTVKNREQHQVCSTFIEGSEVTDVNRTAELDCINVETYVDHVETSGGSTEVATRFTEFESSMTILESDIYPFPTDPALWKPISPDLKRYWSTNGPKNCQNWGCDRTASAREYNEKNKVKVRYFNKSLLQRVLPNGETASRDWLLYSPSTGKIFCFYCTLFGYSNPNNTVFTEKGFDDWKHPEIVHQHEKSSAHFESIKVFKLWEMKNGLVDSQQQLLLQQDEHYWKAVIV